jgi:hypothetical protein
MYRDGTGSVPTWCRAPPRALSRHHEPDRQPSWSANEVRVPWSDTGGSATEAQAAHGGWLVADELGSQFSEFWHPTQLYPLTLPAVSPSTRNFCA